ncbi:hypothetical protein [Chromobacterium amazonense]|uniref:hypothetical protein n=1 Tax=Chromobacterium amazonense TaxID=1382803 RepID=UPI003F7A8704
MAVFLSCPAWGQAKAHLKFHMGLGANGRYEVRATVSNSGDEPVARGYLVVSLRDKQCRWTGDVLQTFGSVAPGQTTLVTIPITGELNSYRLTSFQAFDDMGYSLPAVDDLVDILKARESKERKDCAAARVPA